jgi:hypothetical protein
MKAHYIDGVSNVVDLLDVLRTPYVLRVTVLRMKI